MDHVVKICGLSTPETLDAALAAGADMVGFVRFPKSPRHIDLDRGRALSARAKGRALRAMLVVDADDAFIRSVNGSTARWYREAVANPTVTIHSRRRVQPSRSLTARVEAATDRSSIERTDVALQRKYAGDPSVRSMLAPDILDTTLRLVPA